MPAIILIFCANYLLFVLAAIGAGAFLLSKFVVMKQMAILAIMAMPLSYLAARIGNRIIQSPRPYILEHTTSIITKSTDNGFPSDHTLLAMAITMVVFPFHPKIGTVLFVLTIVIAGARVLGKAHHPIDVIGSIVIAGSITLLVYFGVKTYIFPRLP